MLRTLLNVLIFFSFSGIGLLYGQDYTVELWEKQPPHSIIHDDYLEEIRYDTQGSIRSIGKISSPKIEFFKPESDSNGIGVLVLPGGGYKYIAITKEGYKVAERLNTMGYTVFVLSYRMPSDLIMKDKTTGPLIDAQEAMRHIRFHAKKYGIKADQLGVLGFSAGGHLASSLHTQYDRKLYQSSFKTSAKPDFAALIYPVISMDDAITHQGSKERLLGINPSDDMSAQYSNQLNVDASTTPAFLVHASDDQSVLVENSLSYYKALRAYDVPAALHIYSSGGHGFGLGRSPENRRWIEDLNKWLIAQFKK